MDTNPRQPDWELDTFETNLQHTLTQDRELPTLKPADRGTDAWRLLIAAFVFEALFWGFPTSYGVFQDYYSSQPAFAADASKIPVIGTTAQGLAYLGAPFSAYISKRFHRQHKLLILLGWPLCIAGLVAASFANSVDTLIATEGVMYGLGFVILTYPIINMVSEWWIVRKGMAFGLISAASGVTGIFMPLILESMLQKWGYRITLRASAVALAILTAPLIPALKGRLPVSEATQVAPTDLSFIRKPLFWVYAMAMIIQGLGFFIPSVFIASFATSIGLPSWQGALLLGLLAFAQTVGQFAFGWLSDKNISVSVLSTTCCVVASLSSFLFWGLAKTLPLLVLYSLFYGFFAYGFGTMRVAMGRAVSTQQSTTVAMYAALVFLQGIGNVMVGPVTAALITGRVDKTQYGAERYGSVIVFVATTSIGAGIVTFLPSLRRLIT